MVCLIQSLTGCCHFWLTERSRLPTVLFSRCCLGSRKDRYWTRCCVFSTQLCWSSLLPVMASTCFSMLMRSTPAEDAETAVARLTACLVDIEARLKASWLRLNPTKTQVMWFSSPQQLTNESSVTVSCRCLHSWPPCAAVATKSCGSSDHSSCQPIGRKEAGPHVRFATHCFTAWLRVWWAIWGICRMRLHVWCRALDVTTTSRQCCRSCTGLRFDVGWISRWPSSSTCRCPAWLQHIWPPTVTLSRTTVVVSWVIVKG